MDIKVGVNFDVYACWRKMLKEQCIFSEHSLTCNFKRSAIERGNVHEDSVSIENGSLYNRGEHFSYRFQLLVE
jgi:hypothetical protein